MTGAVIVAAGRSARMGGIDKLIAELGGLPVLRRTLLAVAAAPEVEEIVLVVRPGQEEELAQHHRHPPGLAAAGRPAGAGMDSGEFLLAESGRCRVVRFCAVRCWFCRCGQFC